MWIYEKGWSTPSRSKPNPRMAKYIISQYGGPDGELPRRSGISASGFPW